MGRELISRYEIFRNTIADAGQYLKTLGCMWDVLGTKHHTPYADLDPKGNSR